MMRIVAEVFWVSLLSNLHYWAVKGQKNVGEIDKKLGEMKLGRKKYVIEAIKPRN